MVNDSVVRARINGKIKEEATAVLAAIGLTPSDAFRLLMTRVAQEQALPFDLLIPNEETVNAIKSARSGQVKSFPNLQELMNDLHADDKKEKSG
jgi:DNA-damage-inducible protein J